MAVGREQGVLAGRDAGRVQALDPAHDQPRGDVLASGSAGERGELDLGYLGIGDQPLLVFVPDRVRVADRRPPRLGNRRDRPPHRGIHPRSDREPGPMPHRRGGHVMVVVRGVGAQDHQTSSTRIDTGPRGGDQRVGDQASGTTTGVARAFPQPGRRDHRRRRRRGDRRDQRVDALHPGVAVPGSLLGVAVGRADRVIDVEERDHVPGRQQRTTLRQALQQRRGDRIELTHMAEGKTAKESAQRRRRPHPAEQPAHRAVPQQVHIVDAVRPGDHPGDQRRHLQMRVHPTRLAQRQRLPGQPGQPARLGQLDHRHQPGTRHQSRVIEYR